MVNEIIEEDDELGDQICELKVFFFLQVVCFYNVLCVMFCLFVCLQEELMRIKFDGYNKFDGSKSGGYFVRESLSQLRMSINKFLVMFCDDNKEEDDCDDDDDVMELNKYVEKYCDVDDLRDLVQFFFVSVFCCEVELMSGDEICFEDVEIYKECVFFEFVGSGILISLFCQICVFEELILFEFLKFRNFCKSVVVFIKF